VSIQVEPSRPVAEACGATVTYPPNKYPWITDYLVKSEQDIDKFVVPDFMAGPMTFALQIMPYTDVIKRVLKNPEFVHPLVSGLLQHKVGVAGNIDHIGLLPLQTPGEVEAVVKADIAASGGTAGSGLRPGASSRPTHPRTTSTLLSTPLPPTRLKGVTW
jgi:hypothetical protein